MKTRISWVIKLDSGIKRETRVHVSARHLAWQFKRTDEAQWNYDADPTEEDWDRLEDVLRRRAGRGRSVNLLTAVQKLRAKKGT